LNALKILRQPTVNLTTYVVIMLLVIDVGNTDTVIGIYNGKELVKDWRIRTVNTITEDEFNVIAANLFTGSDMKSKDISSIVISCVVPPLVSVLDSFCRKYLGQYPLWVDAKSVNIMPILYNNPDEVGADRIANSIAAFEKYKTSLIVVDFGTATTFDAVSEDGEYLGGAICPGIMISAEALFLKASKLPRVEIFSHPEKIIGKDTASSIRSGIIYGYAGLVDGIVRRMKIEMGTAPKVVATGGVSNLMADVCDSIEEVEPSLTLEGLRIIYEKCYRLSDK
jgi:type III pantothenate kinase